MPSKTTVGTVLSGIFGLILLGLGIGLIFFFQNMFHSQIDQKLPLKEGSDSYKNWVVPPIPIYFQVWVFHVANHDEVVTNSARPALIEKGPYTYREHRKKVNITFNDNSTVTYREDRSFTFVRDMSVGNESDTFTTINIPMVTIANMIRFEYSFIQELANLILDVAGEKLFLNLTVADIMWGYEDSLLKKVDEILNRTVHKTIDDHFGLFYNQNGSDDGVYNIYTGQSDINKLMYINTWNYDRTLPYWTTSYTNMINGTDGTIYPPFLDSSVSLYLFSSDLCRSLYLDYEKQYSLKSIDLYRYVAPDKLFLNYTLNPDNVGFCTPKGVCLPSGLLNVSECREGAPVMMSQPHFLAADESVQDRVTGLHPDRSQHQTHVDLEPMTGVCMNAAKKLQINVFVEPVAHILSTEKVKPVFLPVLWLNESTTIDDATANLFKNEVQEPLKITQAVQYGLITLGAFILVCILAIGLRRLLSRQIDDPPNPSQQEPLLQN